MELADLRTRRGCAADLAAYWRGVCKFWDPRGRSSRTEVVMIYAVPTVIMMVSALFVSGPVESTVAQFIGAFVLAMFALPIPMAAVRRMHDQARSGWLATPVFALSAITLWSVYLQVTQSYPHNDLWYNRAQLETLYTLAWMAMIIALMLPPKDENNPYGPNPRPQEKVI